MATITQIEYCLSSDLFLIHYAQYQIWSVSRASGALALLWSRHNVQLLTYILRDANIL